MYLHRVNDLLRPARNVAWLAVLFAVAGILAGCQESGPTSEALLEEAKRAVMEGRHADALESARLLLDTNPDDPRTQRIYGEALVATGQPSLAVWPLSRAMRDPDEAVPAGLLLARAQLAGNTGADAITTATRVIELAPDNAHAFMLRARAYLSQNMEEEAIADLDAAIERGLDDDTQEFIRVYALIGLDRIDEAETLLDELHARAAENADEDPKRAAEVCGATAMFAFERGDAERAEQRFEACLEGDGVKNALLVKSAVDFFDRDGLSEKGTAVYRRRFALDESNLAARVRLAERLRRVGRAGEGLELLEAVTDQDPGVWSALVDFHRRREDFAQALVALDHALEANAQPPDSWRMARADFQIILGKLDEAERSLRDVELEVHRAVIEGRLLLARGRVEDAAERLEDAVRLWPDNPDVRFLAASSYERKGDWQKAASHLREAARMDPPHVASSRALAEILGGIGDHEGRAFVLHRLLDLDPNDADAIEGLLESARAVGAAGQVQEMFARLSRIEGHQGRVLVQVAKGAAIRGGNEAALEALDRAIAKLDLSHPFYHEGLRRRCELLLELGRANDARAAIDAEVEKRPKLASLRILRGELHARMGEPEAARRDFESAIDLAPDSVPALIGLAESYAAGGDDGSQARALFERALALEGGRDDDGAAAALAYARFELDAGDRDAGRARIRAILSDQPRNGEAALVLAESLLAEAGEGSPPEELLDVARRAALFEASDRARALYAELVESGGDASS